MDSIKSFWSFLKANPLRIAIAFVILFVLFVPFVAGPLMALRSKIPVVKDLGSGTPAA